MIGKRECPTCAVLRAQVVQLDSLLAETQRRHDAELKELRTERRALTDRLTALVQPALVGLQGQPLRKPPQAPMSRLRLQGPSKPWTTPA